MGIPLPALGLHPPQQPDLLGEAGKALQLKSLMNQQALQGEQLTAVKRENATAQAVDSAYKNALTLGLDGTPQIDKPAVTQALMTSGHGSAIPGIIEGFTKMDQAAQTLQKTKAENAQTEADYMGAAANTILKAKLDPDVMNTVFEHATAAGYGKPVQQLKQMIQQSPDKAPQIFQSMVTGSTKQREVAAQEETAAAHMKSAEKKPEGENPLGPQQVAQLNQAMQSRYQVLNPGKPLPPEFQLPATATQKDYDRIDKVMEGTERAVGTKAQQDSVNALRQQTAQLAISGKADTRSDKSFQYNNSELDKVGKPVEDSLARFGRLQDTVNQNTPQADALVAPELLSVMAGGSGSGLRMNEAEIARIVGGRSKWEDLKASVNKWSLDPKEALSITPEQRQEIRALMNDVHGKLQQKQSIMDQARLDLVNSNDPGEHRMIVAKTRSKLTQIDQSSGASLSFKAPNGKTYNFKDQQSLDNFKKEAGIQ